MTDLAILDKDYDLFTSDPMVFTIDGFDIMVLSFITKRVAILDNGHSYLKLRNSLARSSQQYGL